MKENKSSKYYFHPNEIALLGDTCEAMESFYYQLKKSFPQIRMCYIDGSHLVDEPAPADCIVLGDNKVTLDADLLTTRSQLNSMLSGFDLVVINGHHFKASKQLLFLNEKKVGTVKRRVQELTNVIAFFDTQAKRVPNFISSELPDFSDLPILNDIALLSSKIEVNERVPELSMLILTGGKSSRMGESKEQIQYHGIAQVDFLMNLGKKKNLEVFVSKAASTEQKNSFEILDFMEANGPIVGILSAMRKHRERAFLVVACDMPFIDDTAIETLIDNRDHRAFATCFMNSEKGWNEPLFAIWEPRSFGALWSALGNDFKCPRKLLSQLRVKTIISMHQEWLLNANNQEDKQEALKKIKEKNNGY